MNDQKVWIQYNLYSDSLFDLDSLVHFTIQPIVEKIAKNHVLEKWFFIRYLDETGPHIRLRFGVDMRDFVDVTALLDTEIPKALEAAPEPSAVSKKRLLPIGLPTTSDSTTGLKRKVELAMYEPEVDKYGGPLGVRRAENLFLHSSELAVVSIGQILDGQIDRFELALQIMHASVRRCASGSIGVHDFLDNYVAYWSGALYRQDDSVSQKVKDSAYRRQELTTRIVSTPFCGVVTNQTETYLEAFEDICNLAQTSDEIAKSPEELGFHYVHMMNNRLGVFPVEESYLAALLMTVLQST